MRGTFVLICFLWLGAGFFGLAHAGNYRLAGVQAGRSPIGQSTNTRGYKIRVCVSPLVEKASKNPRQFQIQIGILDDGTAGRNAARLWALYE